MCRGLAFQVYVFVLDSALKTFHEPLSRGRTVPFHKEAMQEKQGRRFRHHDTKTQKAFLFSTAHSPHTMGRRGRHGFFPLCIFLVRTFQAGATQSPATVFLE